MTVAELIETLQKYHKPTDHICVEYFTKEELEYDGDIIPDDVWQEVVRLYGKDDLSVEQRERVQEIIWQIESERESK